MKIAWSEDLTRATVTRRRWPWFWIVEETEVAYQKGYFADEAMTDWVPCEYVLSNGDKASHWGPDSSGITWLAMDTSRRDAITARRPKPLPPPSPWKRVRGRALPEARLLEYVRGKS